MNGLTWVVYLRTSMEQGGRTTTAVHGNEVHHSRRGVYINGIEYRRFVPWDNVAYIEKRVS